LITGQPLISMRLGLAAYDLRGGLNEYQSLRDGHAYCHEKCGRFARHFSRQSRRAAQAVVMWTIEMCRQTSTLIFEIRSAMVQI
jgi:hypothetical protein